MKTRISTKSRKRRKSRLNRKLKKDLGKKLLGYSVSAGASLGIGASVAEAEPIK